MPFQPNNNANPTGKPKTGYQDFARRARKFLDEHTVEEILALANDSKAIKKLPTIDFMIVQRVKEAMKNGGGKSMERLLDRVFGKPKTIILHGGAPDEKPIEVFSASMSASEAEEKYRRACQMAMQQAVGEAVVAENEKSESE